MRPYHLTLLSLLVTLFDLGSAQESTASASTTPMANVNDRWIWVPYNVTTRTVGTVITITDKETNATSLSTKFNEDFINNSSQTIWSRTDTNSLGTVTADIGHTIL
ncbi:hypothetical protein HII31_02502 [Pseudocercospora fuligena]|uniref:Uncharacterized protein n=1 Tax=Pseudocercospora fuligena TaxID=685502 RepID=A0A8H6RTU0_9PEZI|nr:hypothetical protein HII31_02502 [Pseudocercospora fuligena]